MSDHEGTRLNIAQENVSRIFTLDFLEFLCTKNTMQEVHNK